MNHLAFRLRSPRYGEYGVIAVDMVTGMEPVLNFARRWGAPVAAVIFFSLWCVAEAGRMGGSWLTWSGNWALVLMTLAVATASWKPAGVPWVHGCTPRRAVEPLPAADGFQLTGPSTSAPLSLSASSCGPPRTRMRYIAAGTNRGRCGRHDVPDALVEIWRRCRLVPALRTPATGGCCTTMAGSCSRSSC